MLSRMSSLLLGSRFEVVIPEVRGKSKTTEHNLIFGNKIAGRGSLKQRSGLPISDFPRTSGFSTSSTGLFIVWC